jgi:hypothetical protein
MIGGIHHDGEVRFLTASESNDGQKGTIIRQIHN